MNLDDLQALADAATPEPWVLLPDEDLVWASAGDCYVYDNSTGEKDNGEADAAFIAASREAVPYLIARAQRAERAFDRMNDQRIEDERDLRARLEAVERERDAYVKMHVDATEAWHELDDKMRALAEAEHSVEHLYEVEGLRYTGVIKVEDVIAVLGSSPDTQDREEAVRRHMEGWASWIEIHGMYVGTVEMTQSEIVESLRAGVVPFGWTHGDNT